MRRRCCGEIVHFLLDESSDRVSTAAYKLSNQSQSVWGSIVRVSTLSRDRLSGPANGSV